MKADSSFFVIAALVAFAVCFYLQWTGEIDFVQLMQAAVRELSEFFKSMLGSLMGHT